MGLLHINGFLLASKFSSAANEISLDFRPEQPHLAGRRELIVEDHVTTDIDPIGAEGIMTLILERAAGAYEIAPDFGPEQPHLASRRELIVEEHVTTDIDPIGAEGIMTLILERAAGAYEIAPDFGPG